MKIGEDLPVHSGQGGAEGDEPGSMSLMGGVARPEGVEEAGDLEFESLSAGSRLFSRSTMLIVAVVLVAAGALYAMRSSLGREEPDAEMKKSEARIEELLSKHQKTGANPADNLNDEGARFIITQLESKVERAQVPVELTKQNPFALFLPEKPKPKDDGPKIDLAAQRKQAKIARMQSEIQKFKLQSVVPSGARPVAILNGKISPKGGVVGEFEFDGETVQFKIKEITQTGVVLAAEDQTFELKLNND